MLTTPVVFLIFRRPDLTAKVFEEIRRVQPPKLLVVADGPRNEEEAKLCEEARGVIETVDWGCEVYKNYSDINLGCRQRVSSGLDWAFKQVEEAIILEDDCLPSQSFFSFCEVLLDHYRDDTRIWVISGNNFQYGKKYGDGSYYFSRYNHVWGWATWKRAWSKYDKNLMTWPKFCKSGLLHSILENHKEVKFWKNILDSYMTNQIDSWDYIWTYTCWSNSGLTIIPNENLVSNIGFGSKSTHTQDSNSIFANMPVKEILDIAHPTFVIRDHKADQIIFQQNYQNTQNFILRFWSLIKVTLKSPKQSFKKLKNKIRK